MVREEEMVTKGKDLKREGNLPQVCPVIKYPVQIYCSFTSHLHTSSYMYKYTLYCTIHL